MQTQIAQTRQPVASGNLRHDWSTAEVAALFELPFNDLLFRAHTVHRANFDPNRVQLSTLLNIKSGGCPPFPAVFVLRTVVARPVFMTSGACDLD